jgi:hypothetical protein
VQHRLRYLTARRDISGSKTKTMEIAMRTVILTAGAVYLAAAAAHAPAQAQKIPVWNMMRDPQFVIPQCVAPKVLTEIRHSNGRISWRCVTPRKK